MGTSKEQIMSRIAAIEKYPVSLPDHPSYEWSGNLIERFSQSLKMNHAEVKICENGESRELLIRQMIDGKSLVYSELGSDYSTTEVSGHPVGDLKDLELVILQGNTAVAENGAIWMVMKEGIPRVLPFIPEHLVIVVNANQIVLNMHEAYRKISPENDFGVFIAGPSKTADIEQALVIGAHGPTGMTVIIENY